MRRLRRLHEGEEESTAQTVNFALRLLRKVLHHARRRKVIAYDALPENFHFAKETMLKLEMNDSEQAAFISAFDDEMCSCARTDACITQPAWSERLQHHESGPQKAKQLTLGRVIVSAEW